MPEYRQGRWRGVDNVHKEVDVPGRTHGDPFTPWLREARNVRVTDAGSVVQREGYTAVYSPSDAGSNPLLGVASAPGERLLVARANTIDILRVEDRDAVSLERSIPHSGLTPGAAADGAVRAVRVNELGLTLFDDAVHPPLAVKDDLTIVRFGTPLSSGPVNIAVTSTGSLPAGTYRVGVSCVVDGFESGVVATNVELPATGGIEFDVHIPLDPLTSDPAKVNVWMSSPDGEQMLFEGSYQVTSGRTVHIVVERQTLNGRLCPQEMIGVHPAPPAVQRAVFRGRLLSAQGTALWFSPALRYHLVHPQSGFILFPAPIRTLVALDSVVYIVADRTYLLRGHGPDDWSMDIVFDQSAALGSGVVVEYPVGEAQSPTRVAAWLADDGPVIGDDSGRVVGVGQQAVYAPFLSGATCMLRTQGAHSIVCVGHHQTGDSTEARVGDSIGATIVRAS